MKNIEQNAASGKPPFRLLVCGGRDFDNAVILQSWMNKAIGEHRNVLVIHGGARGADRLAGRIAAAAGAPVQEFPADWEKHGNAAGPIRNKQMLVEGRPDLVLAMPGGRGTADMMRQARAAGVEVVGPSV